MINQRIKDIDSPIKKVKELLKIDKLNINKVTDETLLPSHYIYENIPQYIGRGNHSINQLEDLCESFKEYIHQQQLIKQGLIETLNSIAETTH